MKMASEDFIVRVDTPAGFRKTYTFDTMEEANAFALGFFGNVVYGPARVVRLSEEESD